MKQISVYDLQGRLLYKDLLPTGKYTVSVEKRFNSIVIIQVVTDMGINVLKI